MEPALIGFIGILVLFALITLGVPIGFGTDSGPAGRFPRSGLGGSPAKRNKAKSSQISAHRIKQHQTTATQSKSKQTKANRDTSQ